MGGVGGFEEIREIKRAVNEGVNSKKIFRERKGKRRL